MKNIQEILAQYGLTVPEDKTADFDKVFKENYKTVAEVGKIETARDNYKSQLDDATKALKSFEGVDVYELKGEIKTLTDSLKNAESKYQAQITARDQTDWLQKQLDSYGVQSPYARKQLIAECMSEDNGLPWKEGAFLGFDDFMKSAKEKDSGLYQTAEEKAAAEKDAALKQKAPSFTGPLGDQSGGSAKKFTVPKIF